MRHPGYARAVLTYLATPIFLDAWWALVPAALRWPAVVIRTAVEDRALQERLAGWRDCAGRVRYRPLPGARWRWQGDRAPSLQEHS